MIVGICEKYIVKHSATSDFSLDMALDVGICKQCYKMSEKYLSKCSSGMPCDGMNYYKNIRSNFVFPLKGREIIDLTNTLATRG